MVAEVKDPVADAPSPSNRVAPKAARATARGAGDTLGLAWIHGTFQATAYRRQSPVGAWRSAAPVRTLEEFEAALGEAIESLGFRANDAFLVLAHDEFVHQMETAPGFSESSARTYLRARMERHVKENGETLWVSQRAESGRKDSSYVLHMLPGVFYLHLSEIVIRHRLDLTRILPLLVPLQLELGSLGEPAGQPVLLAAEAGDATAVVVGRTPRDVLFVRTTVASWKTEPARVAVEVNRSLLYAKQQFAAIVERLWLMGPAAEAARAEVEAKCGAGKAVMIQSGGPAHWLDLVARLPARHPINLVAGYLSRKRRNRFLRRALVGLCCLGLALLGFEMWNREQVWLAEEMRLEALSAEEPAMQAELDRLAVRNAEVERARAVITGLVEGNIPPAPPKFIALVAAALPREARLSELTMRWDETSQTWKFRAEGTIEADEETARTLISGTRRQLARYPLRISFLDSARPTVGVGTGGIGAPVLQRFTLEGGLFEE